MIPLRDSTPRRTFPFVNVAIIAINIYVFFQQITAPSFERFIVNYGFIPAQFNLLDPSTYFPVLAAMFMHGSLLHIISNLWFLHIFGDNVEDELGHIRYAVFYLLCGVAATATQLLLDTSSTIPLIGASGAISGVAGAYFVLHRHARVETLIPLFFIWEVIDLPARFMLGYWFVIQLLNGVASISSVEEGGVAFMAHVGGFIFGYLYAKTVRKPAAAA